MSKRYYIGLCVTYHDPALAIVADDGTVLYAEATERPLQYKRALNCEPDNLYLLPRLLRRFCRDADELVVAFNWRRQRPLYERVMGLLGYFSACGLLRPDLKRLLSFLDTPTLHHMLSCQSNALRRAGVNLARLMPREFPAVKLHFRHYDHHLCHAAIASYGSPYAEAACLVVDSYGEQGSMGCYRYQNGHLRPLAISRGLESLGFYYMKLTELCGFDWMAGEEWKVMGLAPYGQLDEDLYRLLSGMVRRDGLALHHERKGFFEALERLERYRRASSAPPHQSADLAHTGQRYFADTLSHILGRFHEIAGSDQLALGGGCALNSAYNGQILTRTPFQSLYVPPAPADDGTALGAAWLAFRDDHPDAPLPEPPLSPYLGSGLSPDSMSHVLAHSGLHARHLPGVIAPAVAQLLAQGHVVGWLQGRAEFGPRALGNRSLLADPRPRDMAQRLNAIVKYRESYRPFAPAILHEHGPAWFKNYQESPYMERTLTFLPEVRARVPAVVHVDGSGRLQTVKRAWNPLFHELLSEFYALTEVPLLLNTSYNVMGKPIAHSVEDALAMFLTTGVDALALGDVLLLKPHLAEKTAATLPPYERIAPTIPAAAAR
ncbi:MAG: nodulation protein nolNO [Methylococcaceae bacterium]|nr:MAG: nodulation protein nolNO [Methylococcaceae bacterium]